MSTKKTKLTPTPNYVLDNGLNITKAGTVSYGTGYFCVI